MLISALQSVTFRAVLPTVLLIAAILRPSFISLIYVVLALTAPLLPSIRGHIPTATKTYLYVTFIISFLAAVAQLSYQIYAASSWDADKVNFCDKSDYRYWMNQVGLIKIKAKVSFDVVRVIIPEILSIIFSIAALVICVGLKEHISAVSSPTTNVVSVRQHSTSSVTARKFAFIANGVILAIRKGSDVAVIFVVLVVGIIQPCVLNAVYFLVFLFVMSWYSTYTPLHRTTHNKIKRFLIFYAGLHFILTYMYQIPFFQNFLTVDNRFLERLIGFTPLLTVNCSTWWALNINTGNSWTHFANFFLIIILYYLIIMQYFWTRFGVLHKSLLPNSGTSSIHEDKFTNSELDEHDSVIKSEIQDVDDCGSQISFANSLLTESDDTTQREQMEMQKFTSSGLYRQQVSCIFKGIDGKETLTSQGLITVISFILYQSYVSALLAMMLWALWYHSVFGLLFLVTACILWVFKDTRSAAMKISGGILIYGEFLLIAQYVCSMDISDKLPTSDYAKWIGFIKATDREDAFLVLLIKCLLCLPLFVLYRHHRREIFYENLNDRDRVRRPSYGTFRSPTSEVSANTAGQHPVSLNESRGTQAVSLLTRFLTKYWIFAVHIVILWISLQHPPVLYTIGYFVIFSLSILLFSTSLGLYRRILPIFWTLSIVYSSVVLIAIYCYQFPGIPKKWKEVTGLSDKWNYDIGLINYGRDGGSGILFVRLLAPLSFFIVAMLQLKFFHGPWSRMVTTPNLPVAETSLLYDEPGKSSIHFL